MWGPNLQPPLVSTTLLLRQCPMKVPAGAYAQQSCHECWSDPSKNIKLLKKTFNNGSLGSRIDEERSEMR
jgi:hypothetical protein